MKTENLNKAAKILYNSRVKLKKLNKLPNECTPKNKNEAYKIQELLIKKYLSSNNQTSVIGKKIGCTNKAAQDQINVNEPFFGNIFSIFSAKSNCLINSSEFFNPYIEPEFSFKINKEFKKSGYPYSFSEVYNSIVSVLPSIELVDSRFSDWTTIGINNLIADNGANAYWVYGNEKGDLDSFNFLNHSVKLYINKIIIEQGNSSNVLKNPINALTWLINTMCQQGTFLKKNSYISTGTCTKAIPIKKGDEIEADFGEIGKVNFKFF